MNPPATSDLFRALDETWPPKRFVDQPPWRLREGAGGGQRVSAATASGPITGHQVVEAEAGMRALNQHPLFMLKPGQEKMDQELELKCYDVVDPVAIYLAPTNDIATFCSTDIEAEWPPREATLCLWSDAGIGSGRIAVMKRVPGFKTALASKSGDDVLGAAF
ncbi:MAG: GNAT family N-acetyltransferase, partial [Boseongicola sp.]|nr:GNAT family N-acetyltransferase [Boseongicola sp.]